MTDVYDMRVKQRKNWIGNESVVLNGNLTTMVLKFRRRRLKNIRGLPWKVDGVEKGRDRDMFF